MAFPLQTVMRFAALAAGSKLSGGATLAFLLAEPIAKWLSEILPHDPKEQENIAKTLSQMVQSVSGNLLTDGSKQMVASLTSEHNQDLLRACTVAIECALRFLKQGREASHPQFESWLTLLASARTDEDFETLFLVSEAPTWRLSLIEDSSWPVWESLLSHWLRLRPFGFSPVSDNSMYLSAPLPLQDRLGGSLYEFLKEELPKRFHSALDHTIRRDAYRRAAVGFQMDLLRASVQATEGLAKNVDSQYRTLSQQLEKITRSDVSASMDAILSKVEAGFTQVLERLAAFGQKLDQWNFLKECAHGRSAATAEVTHLPYRQLADSFAREVLLQGDLLIERSALEALRTEVEKEGFVIVTGAAGAGKSTALAQYAAGADDHRRRLVCYHPFAEFGNLHELSVGLASLVEQLLASRRIDTRADAIEPARLPLLFRRTLELPADQPTLVILDAVDTAAGPGGSDPVLRGLFPGKLGQGITVVLSLRGDADSAAEWAAKMGLTDARIFHVGTMSENDVAALLKRSSQHSLRAAAGDRAFCGQLLDRTSGLAIYLQHLVQELEAMAEPDWKSRLHDLPPAFAEFVLHASRDVVALPGWRTAFRFLSLSAGPLSSDDLIALTKRGGDPLHREQLLSLPRPVQRWLLRNGSAVDSRWAFQHASIAACYRRLVVEPEEYLNHLLDYCRAWKENRSKYAIRFLPVHLREGHTVFAQDMRRKFRNELYELAENNDHFLAVQNAFPEEAGTWSGCTYLAADLALETGDTDSQIRFLLLHAYIRERCRRASPLEAARAGKYELAIRLCGMHDPDLRIALLSLLHVEGVARATQALRDSGPLDGSRWGNCAGAIVWLGGPEGLAISRSTGRTLLRNYFAGGEVQYETLVPDGAQATVLAYRDLLLMEHFRRPYVEGRSPVIGAMPKTSQDRPLARLWMLYLYSGLEGTPNQDALLDIIETVRLCQTSPLFEEQTIRSITSNWQTSDKPVIAYHRAVLAWLRGDTEECRLVLAELRTNSASDFPDSEMAYRMSGDLATFQEACDLREEAIVTLRACFRDHPDGPQSAIVSIVDICKRLGLLGAIPQWGEQFIRMNIDVQSEGSTLVINDMPSGLFDQKLARDREVAELEQDLRLYPRVYTAKNVLSLIGIHRKDRFPGPVDRASLELARRADLLGRLEDFQEATDALSDPAFYLDACLHRIETSADSAIPELAGLESAGRALPSIGRDLVGRVAILLARRGKRSLATQLVESALLPSEGQYEEEPPHRFDFRFPFSLDEEGKRRPHPLIQRPVTQAFEALRASKWKRARRFVAEARDLASAIPAIETSVEVWKNLVSIFGAAGHLEEARRLLESDKAPDVCRFTLAETLAKNGYLDECEKLLRLEDHSGPSVFAAEAARVAALHRAGRAVEARDCLDSFVRQESGDRKGTPVHIEVPHSGCFRTLEHRTVNLAKGVEMTQYSLAWPGHLHFALYAAPCYARLGDLREALRLLHQHADRIGPSLSACARARAAAEYEAHGGGDAELASDAFQSARAEADSFPPGWRASAMLEIADALADAGRGVEASRAYAEATEHSSSVAVKIATTLKRNGAKTELSQFLLHCADSFRAMSAAGDAVGMSPRSKYVIVARLEPFDLEQMPMPAEDLFFAALRALERPRREVQAVSG